MKKNTVLLFLLIATILISILSLGIGYYNISISDIALTLLGQTPSDSQAENILLNIRLPRILAAIIIGASLSVTGATYQGIFNNPLVSPDILGVSSGASVGAAVSIFLGFNLFITQFVSFIFGLIAVFFSYLISTKSKLNKTTSLILCGTMIGSICTSSVSILKYCADPTDTLPSITFWLMGSLAKIDLQSIVISLIPIIVGLLILFLARWRINVLVLETSEAQSLGLDAKKWRLIIILAATIITSCAICLGGLIGWVGLMIPHIARFIFGNNYKYLIPSSTILGSLYLLLVDSFIRGVFNTEVPIGILTSLMGSPFFLFLIVQNPQIRKRG